MGRSTAIETLEQRRLFSGAYSFKPVVVYADAGISVTAEIGRFPKLASDPINLSTYTATIDWGDGSTTSGNLVKSKTAGVDVYGSHVFAQPGHFPIAVTLTELTPAPLQVADGASSAVVTPTVTGATLTGTSHHYLTADLGSFTQLADNEIFTGTIHWGDGHISAAKLIGADIAQGVHQDTGIHDFKSAGTFTVRTTIYEHARHSKAKPVVEFDLISTITVS